MAFPTAYKIQIGFVGDDSGLFIIGTSTLDSADTFGVPLVGGFDASDDYSAGRVKKMSWTRGRDANMGPIEHARGSITLHDKTGMFNPFNQSSPLYGLLIPARPIKIEAQFEGVWRDLFNGWTRKIDPQLDIGEKECIIEFVDYLYFMGGQFPVIPTMGPTTTGEAIEAVLDEIGQDPTKRSLDTGDNIPDFMADGGKRATELISDLLLAEQGLFYVDKRGFAVYIDRHNLHGDSVIEYTLEKEISFVRGGPDLDLIQNFIKVMREGGVEQVCSNQASINLYDKREMSAITTPYLNTDNDAQSLGNHLVMHHGDGLPPVWNLHVPNIVSDNALRVIMDAQIASHLRVLDTASGLTDVYHIERMTHNVDAENKRHNVDYSLSQIPDMDAFIIGTSVLSGPEVFVY